MSRRAALAMIGGAALAALPAVGQGAPAGRAARLSRGVNITDWAGITDGIAPSAMVLERLRELGFTAVRLPIDGEGLDRAALAAIEAAIATLVEAGFAVDLDLHILGPSFDGQPGGAEAAAVAAWRLLAPACAAFPPDAVFPELLNEPPMAPKHWFGLRDRLADLVRQSCPDHTIIWGAARYQGIWETLHLPPLPGGNDIVAVHYYFPLGFTHQCQSWGESPLQRIHGLPFPATPDAPEVEALRRALVRDGDAAALAALEEELSSPWTAEHIRADFDGLAAWSARTGTPAIVNEFGVLAECTDATSRANWTQAVRRAAEASGIGWFWWELDRGFGFLADRRDADGFDSGLVAALRGGAS